MMINGIIFCHDILNGGKGVEVKEYTDEHGEKFNCKVLGLNGDPGILKITCSQHWC